MRRLSPVVLLVAIAAVLSVLYVGGQQWAYSYAHSRVLSNQTSPNTAAHDESIKVQIQQKLGPATPYIYSALKQANGFVLARAMEGNNGQPEGNAAIVASFGNQFGLSESDSITTMQLSPDGRYLAINGARDHGEQVWIFDTVQLKLSLTPANVLGNFLNWMPAGNGHTFLYRPMFPQGPDAPLNNGVWNPGLWEVNAATSTFTNINIHMPSAFLVDAAASPDGSRIIYSTSSGLGMGSDTWLMSSNGSNISHLFTTSGGGESIAAMFTWSPDGHSIAYQMLADSPTPFLPAGLWLMNTQGGQQRLLAETDGGHGYKLSWSPDSSKIAYIARTNISNSQANLQAQALQCAVAVVTVATAHSELVASPSQTGMQLNYAPTWSTDSSSITFIASNPANLMLGGSPRYWSANLTSSQMKPSLAPLTPEIPHVVAVG
jgi:Tol biopolymer transport system component